MKAMLLAAGYGTRFQPVTLTLPKPLIPVCNRPLIGWPIESFLAQGVRDFVDKTPVERSPAAHTEHIARLWSRLSEIAASNQYAWIKHVYSSAEIATPTPANRLVSTPYTKLLTANIQVNMASGLILASADAARQAGVPSERWICIHGGAQALEEWHVSERAELDAGRAIAAAGRALLRHADIEIDDVAQVDLYSCFPAAVEIAARELGLSIGDPARAPSVTGGLTFAGGPGNNYSSHAIATLVHRLREAPDSYGLTSAVGWYMTKHALGLYAGRPPRQAFASLHPQPSHPPARRARTEAVVVKTGVPGIVGLMRVL